MRESKKQTLIATMALIVSIISLVATIIIAHNEYKENVEVIPEHINIVSADLDDKVLNCEIELIVANTSHSSVSIIKAKVYKTYSGFKESEEMNIVLPDEWPITLIAGGAAKISLKCEYKLDEKELSAIQSSSELDNIFEKRWLSVRIYTTKTSPYYGNAKFGEVKIPAES